MNLKDNVLAELIHTENNYISGSQLAKKFNVSRTAIWKCIEQFKAEGCQIGAVTKRGYILLVNAGFVQFELYGNSFERL